MNIHRKKKAREFSVPSRDVTTKLSLGGNNDVITELFPPRGSLVSDIPAGDGKLVNLFLRCTVYTVQLLPFIYKHILYTVENIIKNTTSLLSLDWLQFPSAHFQSLFFLCVVGRVLPVVASQLAANSEVSRKYFAPFFFILLRVLHFC